MIELKMKLYHMKVLTTLMITYLSMLIRVKVHMIVVHYQSLIITQVIATQHQLTIPNLVTLSIVIYREI